MGKWIKRAIDTPVVPPHAHDYPMYNDDGKVYPKDIWRCKCTMYFQVSNIAQGTDGLLISWRPMWPDETKDLQ